MSEETIPPPNSGFYQSFTTTISDSAESAFIETISAATDTILGIGLSITIFAAIISLYFLPWLIAKRRAKRNASAILILNLLLGWTFVGWVIALTWAMMNDRG